MQKSSQASRPVVQIHPAYPAFFIIGKKGAGKSALLERMLEVYYRESYQIMDMNCAADLESLQWVVPGNDGVAYPILVILPLTTQLKIMSPRMIKLEDGREVEAVKTILDTTPLQEIIREAQSERRVIVFSIHYYDSEVNGQKRFAHFIKVFPKVVRDHLPRSMKFAIGLRELTDLSSNRMLTFAGSGEKESKRSLNYFSRVARHFRTVLIMDMQDPESVYSQLVAQEDFILVKRLNKNHVPDKLRWLQEDIKLKVDYAKHHYMLDRLDVVSLDRLTNNSFYCVWPDGDYTLEHYSMPGFKHHASDDDALALAGLAIKYLSRADLEESDTAKIEAIKQRREEEIQKEKAIIEAIRLHEEEGLTWDEVAIKTGWLVDGKPSGNAVKQAAKRFRARQNTPT